MKIRQHKITPNYRGITAIIRILGFLSGISILGYLHIQIIGNTYSPGAPQPLSTWEILLHSIGTAALDAVILIVTSATLYFLLVLFVEIEPLEEDS